MKNKYCERSALNNESDVEQKMLYPLIKELGYNDTEIKTKESIEAYSIGKERPRKRYRPDYIIESPQGIPVLVWEAKSPKENIDQFKHEPQYYSMILNQKYDYNPVKRCVISNGAITYVLEVDKEEPILRLEFSDFVESNYKFIQLKNLLSKRGDVIEGGPGFPDKSIFFGRTKEINKALKLLKEHSFAITGIKGVGKSKLASVLFEKIKKNFKEARRYEAYEGLSFYEFGRRLVKDLTNEDIFGRIFGRSEVGEETQDKDVQIDEQVQLVVDTLKEKQCLLLIDQFEAVIDWETGKPKDQGFAKLLKCAREGIGRARLVVTAWEIPKDSDGLLFRYIRLEGVDDRAAIKIIENNISEEDRPILKKSIKDIKILIKRMQGHPIALQCIASNLSQTIKEINDPALWGGELEEIATKVVSMPYTRISQNPDLKKILHSICIFPKPCDINALSIVTKMVKKDILQGLTELSRMNLVSIFREEGTYGVHHDLVREYVLSQLSDEEKIDLHSKIAVYYRSRPCPSPENRKSIDDVYPLLDAIDHLISANKSEEAANLFIEEKLHEDLHWWGNLEELEVIYKRFKKENISEKMLSIFLGKLGLVYRDWGNYQEAKRYYQEALTIAKECKNKESEYTQIVNLGDVYYYLGEVDQSIEKHNQAKKFLKETKNKNKELKKLEGRNFGCLGNALHAKGDLQKAKEYYEQAIAICREVRDRRYEGIWLGDLGNVYANEHDFKKAIECYEQAHAIAKETGDRRHESFWLGVLGNTYHELGELQKARECFEKALSISKRIIYRRGIHYQLQGLGNISSSSGELSEAIEYYKEALNISKKMKNPENEISDLWNIGILYFDLQDFSNSIKYLEEALIIAKKMDYKQEEENILSKIGESYSKLEQFDKAVDYFSQAIDIAKEDEERVNECNYISMLGGIYISQGQFDKAMECFIQAENIAKEIGDKHYEYEVQSFFKEKIEEFNRKNKKIESLFNELTKVKESRDLIKEMEVCCNLGDIYTLLIQFEEATRHYSNALEIARNIGNQRQESIFLSKLGNISFFSTQFKEAIDYYQQAIVIAKGIGNFISERDYNNQLCEIYLAEGKQLFDKDQIETALEKYQKAMEISPNFAKVYQMTGSAYLKLGKLKGNNEFFDKAIENYTRAIHIKPTSSLYHERANCYAYKKNLDEAISDYGEAIKLNTQNISAILSKMEIEIWLGRYSEARTTYKDIRINRLSLQYKAFASYFICLALSLDGIPYEDYIAPLKDKKIKLRKDIYDPADIEPYIFKLKDTEISRECLDNALMIHDLFKRRYILEGDLDKLKQVLPEAYSFYEKGDFKKAAERYTEVLEIDPTLAYVYSQRGLCYRHLAKSTKSPENYLDMAIQDFTKAIEIEPNNDNHYVQRAGCYSQKGQWESSIPDYWRATRLNYLNKMAFLGKMEVEICLRRYNEATATYKRLKRGTLSDKEKVIASSLICISLALNGLPYKDYIDPLNDMEIKLSDKHDWLTLEIDQHLAELEKEGYMPGRVDKAKEIQDLFKKHFVS